MAKNSSPSRAPKTGAQLRDNRRSAKNDAKSVKIPLIAAITKNAGSVVPVCVAQLECPLKQAMTEFEAPPLCKTLSLTITGMSTTLSKTRRRDEPAQQGHRPRDLAVFRRLDQSSCRCTTTGMATTVHAVGATVGARLLLHECNEELHDLQTQHRSPCQ